MSRYLKYFVLTRHPEGLEFNKIHWIVLILAGLLGFARDYIIYILDNPIFNYNPTLGIETIDYDFSVGFLHAVIELFMIILLYKVISWVYTVIYNDPQADKNRLICYVAQFSLIKDALFLVVVAVYSISHPLFPATRNEAFYILPNMYWILYALYVVVTVLYLSSDIVKRLKVSYRNINSLLVASYFISLVAFFACWGIIWIVRLLISLPFGEEFVL